MLFQGGDKEVRITQLINEYGEGFWIAWNAINRKLTPLFNQKENFKRGYLLSYYQCYLADPQRVKDDLEPLMKVWLAYENNIDLEIHDYITEVDALLNLVRSSSNVAVSDKDIFKWLYCQVSQFVNKFCNKLNQYLMPESNKDDFRCSILNLEKILDLLRKENAPLPIKSYDCLNESNWFSWVSLLSDCDLEILEIIPKEGTIQAIFNNSNFFGNNNLDEKLLKAAIVSVKITPNFNDWKNIVENLASWLKLNRGESNDLVYELMLGIIQFSPDDVVKSILESVQSKEFWYVSSLEEMRDYPHLPILSSVVFGKNLQSNEFVSENVKNYWFGSFNDDEINKVYEMLLKFGQLSVIWKLALDKRNSSAIEIIKNKVTKELYSCEEGIYYLDEFEFFDDDFLSMCTKNLIKYGSFEANKENLKNETLIFHGVLFILLSCGNDSAKSYCKGVVSSLSQKDWLLSLLDGNKLLKCLSIKNKNFSLAFKNFYIAIINGDNIVSINDEEIEMDESGQTDISVLADFINLHIYLDDVDAIFYEITKSYFLMEDDRLDNKAFDALSHYMKKSLKNINENLIFRKIDFWVSGNHLSRIQWFIDSGISIRTKPDDSLSEVIVDRYHGDSSNFSLWKSLVDMLNIKINVDINQDDDS